MEDVRGKWIYKSEKGLSPNESLRFIARLVAEAFNGIPCTDHNDVFSSVVNHIFIHAFFDIVAMHDLDPEQLDAKTVFLHELEKKIYMDQPESLFVPGKHDFVCK
jgi:hypothetical protein